MDEQKRNEDIRRIVQAREIEFLGHFTLLDNLPNIIRYGLLPGRHVIEMEIDQAYCPDPERKDDPDGRRGRPLCMTPSGINQELIKAMKHRYRGAAWAFISVPSSVMWTHWCEFFYANAAKDEFRKPNSNLWRPYYLSQIFGEQRDGRPSWMPARSDAEVQVFDPISPDLIAEIWVETHRAANMVHEILGSTHAGQISVKIGPLQDLRDDRSA